MIDILILYTPKTFEGRDEASVRKCIEHGVRETQEALENSAVRYRVALLASRRIDFEEEETDNDQILRLVGHMTERGDDVLEEAHELRETADIVGLVVEGRSTWLNGFANTMTEATRNFEACAFFAVRRATLESASRAMAHEIAHVFGCCHGAREDPKECAAAETAHGWWVPCPDPDANHCGFLESGKHPRRTVESNEGDVRIPHFSNPDVRFPLGDPDGSPTGHTEHANCAQLLNDRGAVVASFRLRKRS